MANTEEPITGPYGEMARRVREIMGELSARQGQNRTGISHSTITDMKKGIRPKSSTLERFARGFKMDPNPLLRAAGYPEMGGSDEITYVHDPEMIPVPEGYQDLDDPIIRAGATRLAQRAYAEYVDAMRQLRAETGLGVNLDRYSNGTNENRSKNNKGESDGEGDTDADSDGAVAGNG